MDNNDKYKLKEVGLKRFLYDAVSELWSYELWTFLITTVLIAFIRNIAKILIITRDDALTTSNLFYVLFSPQGFLIILIGISAVLIYMAIEIFGEIIFIGDLFEHNKKGRIISRVLYALKEGFKSLRLFFNPLGILCFVYVFLISPLIDVGFTISMTDGYYIPNFIMDVINKNVYYFVPFYIFLFSMTIVGFLYIFTYHGVLLSKEPIREAMRKSRIIVTKNWKNLIFRLVRLGIAMLLIRGAFALFFDGFVADKLQILNTKIPDGYIFDLDKVFVDVDSITQLDLKVVLVRIFTIFSLLEGDFIQMIVKVLTDAYTMIAITRYYLEYNNKLNGIETQPYSIQKRRINYALKFIMCFIGAIGIGIASIFMGLFAEDFLHNHQDTKIVVHRTGGILASENSIDGLLLSIENNCYGAETDVQRTKDGHYVINHDDNFKRLTGVDKASQDMTLAEVRELKIKDTTGSGKILQVPTLEEFLDVIKGKIKLFLELKGVTADNQMVDDVVRIIKEKGCEKDVVLISLKYDVMNYAETKYPDFDTGLLFFGGFGDVADLNVDFILMEEEMSSKYIGDVKDNNKTSGIWTVNHDQGMINAFDLGADTIITDDMRLFNTIKTNLDNRTDFEVIRDWCERFLN